MNKILIIFGTRPEAIKLAPVITKLNLDKRFKTIICSTGQHREMLNQVLDIFQIKPDYDLDLMKKDQDLFDISSNTLKKLKEVLNEIKPSVLIVQGDTTTAFISALSAYYLKIKVAHVEAGLRSFNVFSPYPEEANRKFISVVTDIHFAPTLDSKQNLISEGVPVQKIHVTGNTVIDALLKLKGMLEDSTKISSIQKYLFDFLPKDFFNKNYILITIHRREKFGVEFEFVLNTIKEIAQKHKELNFVYPVHLNPNVQKTCTEVANQPKKYLSHPPTELH